MKKILITLIAILTLIFAYTLNNNSQTIQAAETDANYLKTGLGYSINAIKSKYIDITEIRDGSPIFDESWLSSYISNISPVIVNGSNIYSLSGSSFAEIVAKMNMKLEYSSDVKGYNSIFIANAESGFDVSSGINFKTYISQYYYMLSSMFERYTYSLPNYSSNLSTYRLNLHQDYLIELDKFFSEKNTAIATTFFDKYGTHLIAKGVYGGKLEAYYGAVSNKLDVGGGLNIKITSGLDAGILGKMQVGESIWFDLSTTINKTTESVVELFRAKAYGGFPLSATSISNLSYSYENWCNSIESNPSLIRTTSDGLIPLWNLLPDKYNDETYKNIMLNFYKEYAINYYKTTSSEYDKGALTSLTYESGEKLIRSMTYRIDDSGRFVHDKHDIINVNELTHYGVDILKAHNYKFVDVNIKILVKEINKGYQYICLYNNDEKSDNYKLCDDFKFEYKGSDLGTAFDFINCTFKNILIEKLSEFGKLVIRYGASGTGDDDWENKELYIELIYKK